MFSFISDNYKNTFLCCNKTMLHVQEKFRLHMMYFLKKTCLVNQLLYMKACPTKMTSFVRQQVSIEEVFHPKLPQLALIFLHPQSCELLSKNIDLSYLSLYYLGNIELDESILIRLICPKTKWLSNC